MHRNQCVIRSQMDKIVSWGPISPKLCATKEMDWPIIWPPT